MSEAVFVACDGRVLVDDGVADATLRGVLTAMLARLPRHDTRVSYQFEQRVVHFVVENAVVYGCVTALQYDVVRTYAMLDEVRRAFRAHTAGSAEAYARPDELTPASCRSFARTLAALRARYDKDDDGATATTMEKIHGEIANARQVMLENVDALLARGERVEALCDRTAALQSQAGGFASSTRTLRRTLLRHQLCALVLGGVTVAGLLALLIAMAACGARFDKCSHHSAPHDNHSSSSSSHGGGGGAMFA